MQAPLAQTTFINPSIHSRIIYILRSGGVAGGGLLGLPADFVGEPRGGEDLRGGAQGQDGALKFVFGAQGELVVGEVLAGAGYALAVVDGQGFDVGALRAVDAQEDGLAVVILVGVYADDLIEAVFYIVDGFGFIGLARASSLAI